MTSSNPTYAVKRHAELYAELMKVYDIKPGGNAGDVLAVVAAILLLAESKDV